MANDNSYNTIAVLNGVVFPYSPNSVNFTYNLNKVSFNTVSGRVTQLVSIKVNTITWEGDTGNRDYLLNLYAFFKQIQDQQIENESSSLLIMPTPIGSGLSSLSIPMQVWARSMQLGWNFQSVTYPYRIQLELDEGFGDITSGVSSSQINALVSNAIGNQSGSSKNDIVNSIYTGLINTTNISTDLGSAVNAALSNAIGNENNTVNTNTSGS